MKLWRCEYTGEMILALSPHGGRPLFGGIVPFLGWKWVACDCHGQVDNETWPPRFVSLKFGAQWLNHGSYWTPYRPKVRAVRVQAAGEV